MEPHLLNGEIMSRFIYSQEKDIKIRLNRRKAFKFNTVNYVADLIVHFELKYPLNIVISI